MQAQRYQQQTTAATRRIRKHAPREAFRRHEEREALCAANDNFASKRTANDNRQAQNAMNAHERLPGVHGAFKWQNFIYDMNAPGERSWAGNITRESNETNTTLRQYSYDMEGRLLTMGNGTAGYEVRFFYDGMGRRILQKTTSSGTTTYKRYLWCGQTLCQQRDTGTNPLRRYLATGEYVNASGGNPAKKYVYFTDHLGSVRDFVDATTGARVGALDYKPYGAVKASTGVLPDYQYAGLMWVPEVGLNASATRFYDPGTTRWMTRDWDEAAGLINGYNYAPSNPINWVDPMGTCVTLPGALVCAAARAAFAAAATEATVPTAVAAANAGGAALAAGAARTAAALAPAAVRAASQILPTPKVADPKLQNIVRDLYKGTTNPNRVCTGTTSDAIRNEILTGQPTGGTFHTQKGQQYVNALENWIKRNPNATYSDGLVARSLLDDLRSALQTPIP